MAKATVRSPSGSKIRFIMLEADLSDGDLSEVTKAITGALSRAAGVGPRLVAATSHANGGASVLPPVEESPADIVAEPDDEAGTDENGAAVEASRPRQPRKYPTPHVLPDVDLNSGDAPFETFAKGKNPSSDLSRFLLVAHWFKAHRSLASVTADHIFTGYKKMGWGTAIRDFSQPFRDLARQGKGDFKGRQFTINHIGEDAVEKMGRDG